MGGTRDHFPQWHCYSDSSLSSANMLELQHPTTDSLGQPINGIRLCRTILSFEKFVEASILILLGLNRHSRYTFALGLAFTNHFHVLNFEARKKI